MSTESVRAERFLDAFHRIESFLAEQQTDKPQRHTFYELVRKSTHLTEQQKSRLREVGDLRNSIVHEPGAWGKQPIATPREDIVIWLEAQVSLIEKPPRVYETLKLQPPEVLEADSDLSSFLELVSDEDFSQAPVRLEDGSLSLITTNAVARWVASGYQRGEGVALDHAKVKDVLGFAEIEDKVFIAPRTFTAVEAVREFAGATGRAVPAAIVLTQNGKKDEKPIGICSRTDIAILLHALGV